MDACAEGEDKALRAKMPTLTEDNIDEVFGTMNAVPGGFNTIIHNDLHMNNALYRYGQKLAILQSSNPLNSGSVTMARWKRLSCWICN